MRFHKYRTGTRQPSHLHRFEVLMAYHHDVMITRKMADEYRMPAVSNGHFLQIKK